ncbi:serine hydrolase domain-containing protein [Paenibacillus sonchi]|uniref:serine hydrolase domain-containing protein n=1 Tax=Paenibacillus sonchi TaxID=373687 RepID=UPI001E3ABC12|nr:serine hydrolase domain-containing protein [Paenibacillus sonchi]MCE3201107.1 beta-lactamase family protein [Paenibacillus sonchi]
MKKIIAVVMSAMLIAIPISGNQASAQPHKNTVLEKAHKLASAIVSDYGVTGLQYAIMDKGKIVLSDSTGVRNKAANAPITKDTMFGIGSVSKMYVTAAAMMLADAGKIDIDQPLVTYIKDFSMADERYKEITPRMLMNHSSGLYGSHYANSMLFDDNDTRSRDELLMRLQSEHLKSKPGEYSVYCNDGFQLLEILVERVSGLSYTEFLDQKVNQPLKLTSTKTPLSAFDREKLAKTYYPGTEQALPVENANVIGAGGLYSTAEELAAFGDVLIGNRTDILSEKSAAAMQSPEYRKGIWVPEETNSFNYGLGWDAVSLAPFDDYGIKALSKGGDTVMYHAALTSLPEHNISIAVLSSGGSSLYNTVFASNVLLEYLQDNGKIKEIVPDRTFEPSVKVSMPAEQLAYSGLYGAVGTTMNVEMKNGEMKLPALEGGIIPPQTYVYTGNGQFKSNDGKAAVSFDKQSNGKIYFKLKAYVDFPGIGQAVMVTYEYQKLDANPLQPATKAAWKQRNNKNYYGLDEKINSLFYLSPVILIRNITVDSANGYASGTRIVDEHTAVNAAEIPVMSGRDAFDLSFHTEDNKEYLTIDGQAYLSEDAVNPIYGGGTSICTIEDNGHAVWFKIDAKSAAKTMRVEAPPSGGVIVYDGKGMLVYSSIVNKEKSVVLPEGGMIVFGGEAGDVFQISMKK